VLVLGGTWSYYRTERARERDIQRARQSEYLSRTHTLLSLSLTSTHTHTHTHPHTHTETLALPLSHTHTLSRWTSWRCWCWGGRGPTTPIRTRRTLCAISTLLPTPSRRYYPYSYEALPPLGPADTPEEVLPLSALLSRYYPHS